MRLDVSTAALLLCESAAVEMSHYKKKPSVFLFFYKICENKNYFSNFHRSFCNAKKSCIESYRAPYSSFIVSKAQAPYSSFISKQLYTILSICFSVTASIFIFLSSVLFPFFLCLQIFVFQFTVFAR